MMRPFHEGRIMASFGSFLGGLARKVFGGGSAKPAETAPVFGSGGKRLAAKQKQRDLQKRMPKSGSSMPGNDIPTGFAIPMAVQLSPLEKFLYGETISVTSSNVQFIQYARDNRLLFIGFRSGAWYGYEDISEAEATSFYNAGSRGGWVWDRLRVRGTVFGRQKEYFFMDGPSTAAVPGGQTYEPKWHQTEEWRREHGQIPASGDIPKSWKEGTGPYPPWFG